MNEAYMNEAYMNKRNMKEANANKKCINKVHINKEYITEENTNKERRTIIVYSCTTHLFSRKTSQALYDIHPSPQFIGTRYTPTMLESRGQSLRCQL